MENWEDRELCPDEACIGVIGEDGKCRVCGKPGTRQPRSAKPAALSGSEVRSPKSEVPAQAPAPQATDDWDDRRLCADESCIGVLGPDGTCKVCGK